MSDVGLPRLSFYMVEYRAIVGSRAKHNDMAYTIHIGRLIEEQFTKRGCTISWFARQINCDRTNVYGIFKRETIDVKRLYEIGKVLEYDFFQVLSDELNEENDEED